MLWCAGTIYGPGLSAGIDHRRVGPTPHPHSPRAASRAFFLAKSPENPGSWFSFEMTTLPRPYGGDSVGRKEAVSGIVSIDLARGRPAVFWAPKTAPPAAVASSENRPFCNISSKWTTKTLHTSWVGGSENGIFWLGMRTSSDPRQGETTDDLI